MSAKKKTFRRYCVIKNCPHDFGMGPGVIYRDEVTYRDPRGHGFNNALFSLAQRQDAEEIILDIVTVLFDEKKPRDKWNLDPQKSFKKAHPKAWRKK